jgi:hypothetical protein
MITHRQLEEAQEFFNYGVKEGYFEPEDFKDMSDEDMLIGCERMNHES